MTDSPAPLPDSAPRWATEADNEALLELVRACPMKGSIEMLFDRSPDFFALSHLQGDGANICVVDDPASGKLAAVAAMAPLSAVYVDGAVRSADYACDLRVRPEWRGSGLYKQVYQHIEAWSLGRGEGLGFTTVMKGNRAMARIVAGRAGVVPYHHITTLRNFTVHFLFKKRPLPGITIRPAPAADIPEMVALWSRLN
ncbi:MAG: hypothetical protein H7338_02045, partial [Candidatus Sericytochromatia bacterium]|nr:hypothetical protein [Candidatus Sericytochromatia bacterium]